MVFQAGLLTRIHLNQAPSRHTPVASSLGHPPYSVGHVAESHRLPDSPVALQRRAPESRHYLWWSC